MPVVAWRQPTQSAGRLAKCGEQAILGGPGRPQQAEQRATAACRNLAAAFVVFSSLHTYHELALPHVASAVHPPELRAANSALRLDATSSLDRIHGQRPQTTTPNDKSADKKPAPQGGNLVWYMLGLGVLLLLMVTMFTSGSEPDDRLERSAAAGRSQRSQGRTEHGYIDVADH